MMVFGLIPAGAGAGDRDFRLSAPAELIDSGLLKFLLPRFSLKTSIRVEVVGGDADAEVAFTYDQGRAVFVGAGSTWHMSVNQGHEGAARFADWLMSDVGQRTVTGYLVNGAAPFTLAKPGEVVEVAIGHDGNVARGLLVSSQHCGRCHVVSDDNRMNAIGSTPSFFVLRTLGDWDARFESFYALKPHPAFTQIEEVTPPFAANLPSPIIPVEITLDDLDAILAYVSQLAPADLGAPLEHQ